VVVSLGVIAAALGIAVRSVQEIFLPHRAPAPFTLSFWSWSGRERISYRLVIRLGKDTESTAVKTDAWHHRTDALTSIAAFIGISIALVGARNGRAPMRGRLFLPAR
jgi:divalent metal cation (Fe/Co/Zn/Cd) transporter